MRGSPFVMRPATAADARYLATRLRASDLAEVKAVYDDPHAALLEAITGSEICHVGEIGGQPVVIVGCAKSADRPLDVGVPWLLGTDELTRRPGALTKLGRAYLALFRERWPTLLNFVDARNTASIRWLKRLGFDVRDPVEFGMHGERFHPFVLGA